MEEDIKILSQEEISDKLKRLSGWLEKDNKIAKEFIFKNFLAALEFVNDLAPYFQEKDHHPDIYISYKKVIFELTHHNAGGRLTELDFLVAGKIQSSYDNQN